MKPIVTRTISGAVYIVLMLGSVLVGPLTFGLVQFIFLILCLTEFKNMFEQTDHPIKSASFILSGILIYLIVILYLFDIWGMGYLLLIILVIFKLIIGELFKEHKNPIVSIGVELFGLLYIVLPFALLNFFFYPELNFGGPANYLLIGLFIVIWGNDTFAYLSGMMFGKHKLFERISPKKTWEGAIGGGIFAIIAAIVLAYFFPELSTIEWIGFALIIIIFGTFGDLFESLIKRSLGLKDSGTIMPGHGGILDRFDSILMAVPFAYIYVVFVIN